LTDFLKIHAGYALNHGASEEEIKEIANIVVIPGGFPRAIMASQAIYELLAARGR
jgi:4-carboxymuconolactone decarboxylase